MPKIYLSPSLQQYNQYINGGTEEEYMNLLADAMEPYLRATGIEFTRNNPEMSLSEAIKDSNKGQYDLHVALHSNAAPESLAGLLQGPDVYYWANSYFGRKAADIIAKNLDTIYTGPREARALPTTTLAELKKTTAPSVLLEVAYHDNPEDAAWIKNNLDTIAENIVRSLAEYFGIPFVRPH